MAAPLDGLITEHADRQVPLLSRVRRLVAGLDLGDELATVELHFFVTAVEELDIAVAVELEVPVGVGREPPRAMPPTSGRLRHRQISGPGPSVDRG